MFRAPARSATRPTPDTCEHSWRRFPRLRFICWFMTSAVFSVWSGHATTRARAQHRDSFYNHFLELSGGRGLAANLLLGGRLVRWAVGATLKGGNRLDARVVESWARPWSGQRILRGLDHFS